MRKYELTYLISDNVPESDLNKTTGKIAGYITGLEGKILKEEIWGRRKLAYPIKKQDFATYVTLNFELSAEKTKELERDLRLSSKVVRHLLIVQDFGDEELVLTKEDIAENEDIQEVIGGEKSFEAVKGETEESKDLMAVRGEAEDEEEKKEKETETETEQDTVEVSEKPEEEKVENEEEAKSEIEDEEIEEDTVEPKEEVVEEKTELEEKPAKKSTKKIPEKEKKEDEADRLSKLDKELDDILGEDKL